MSVKTFPMLTRHFYELDEVVWSLKYCLRNGKIKDAVYWAREIILSEEDDVLSICMLESWLLFLGTDGLHWLDAWTNVLYGAVSIGVPIDIGGCKRLVLVAEFCRLVCSLKRRRLPNTLKTFFIASRGLSPVVGGNPDLVSDAVAINDPFSLYWHLGAEYEKKPLSVLDFVSGCVDSPEIFNSYRLIINALRGHSQIKMLLSVASVVTLCMDSIPADLETTLDSDVASWIGTWEAVLGRRGGRIYAIEEEGLPKGFKRSSQAETLLCSATAVMESGCTFWRNVACLIQDDDTLESIVGKYFPDDIPDEWSTKDRSLSHPIESKAYTIHIKPEYRIRKLWGFCPVFRKVWLKKFVLLLTACSAPSY
jgi:hypothetical protein